MCHFSGVSIWCLELIADDTTRLEDQILSEFRQIHLVALRYFCVLCCSCTHSALPTSLLLGLTCKRLARSCLAAAIVGRGSSFSARNVLIDNRQCL